MSRPGDLTTVVCLRGEIDADTSRTLDHTKRLAGGGRRMLTVASTPHIVRLLRITAVTGPLNIHPSVPAAMTACLTRFGAPGTGTPSG